MRIQPCPQVEVICSPLGAASALDSRIGLRSRTRLLIFIGSQTVASERRPVAMEEPPFQITGETPEPVAAEEACAFAREKIDSHSAPLSLGIENRVRCESSGFTPN